VTLITAFEVPPDADEPFIAAWERARALAAAGPGFLGSALHRALRPDVSFRFVDVARIDGPEAWTQAAAQPVFPDDDPPFAAHRGLYDVVRHDGAPTGDGGVILINAFEVSPADDARFLTGWEGARAALAAQRGYLGTRLHRAIGPADFRFVNIARWSSPLAFSRAVGGPRLAEAAAELPFTSHPALYQVVRD
jgi:heme-degrading monooxygenase HmoA